MSSPRLALLAMALAAGPALCAPAQTPAPRAPLFPLGVYWPWEDIRTKANADVAGLSKWDYTARVMDILAEQHVNFIWVIHMVPGELPRFCQLAGARGMRVAASTYLMSDLQNLSGAQLRERVAALVETWRTTEALVAYVGIDEPHAPDLHTTNRMRAVFEALDPGRLFTAVVRPHEIPLAMRCLDQRVIGTDPYCFFHPGVPWYPVADLEAMTRRYCERIGLAARLAREHGKILWSFPQAFEGAWPGDYYMDDETGRLVLAPGSIPNFRMCTPAELTWQVWAALAAGVRGFIPFLLLDKPKPLKSRFEAEHGAGYKVDCGGNPRGLQQPMTLDSNYALLVQGLGVTPQLQALGRCYAALAPALDRLALAERRPSVVHAAPPFTASSFQTPDGRWLAVAVNNNLDGAAEAELTVLPAVTALTVLRPGGGATRIATAGEPGALRTCTLRLEAGEGAVLDLDCGERGIEVLLDMQFDTAVPTRAGLRNVKVDYDAVSRRHFLRLVQPVYGHLEYRLKDWRRKLLPGLYADAALFLALEAAGKFLCEFRTDAGETLASVPWQGRPAPIPAGATVVRVGFQAEEARLFALSVLSATPAGASR